MDFGITNWPGENEADFACVRLFKPHQGYSILLYLRFPFLLAIRQLKGKQHGAQASYCILGVVRTLRSSWLSVVDFTFEVVVIKWNACAFYQLTKQFSNVTVRPGKKRYAFVYYRAVSVSGYVTIRV